MVSWSSSCSPSPREGRFCIYVADNEEKKQGKNIALIGTDECLQLFSGILDETDDKTGHLLGKEHVFKNIQKKLEKLNFPNKQMKWIINDTFGHPFDSEKKD